MTWARLRFEELFANNIKQLLFNFPLDSVTSTGTPFWSGPKRAPTPLVFDVNNPLHLSFIKHAARLRADVYGIPSDKSVDLEADLGKVKIPVFVPKSGVKIQVKEEDSTKPSSRNNSPPPSPPHTIPSQLPSPSSFAGVSLNPLNLRRMTRLMDTLPLLLLVPISVLPTIPLLLRMSTRLSRLRVESSQPSPR